MKFAYITLPNSGTHILQPVFGDEEEATGWPGYSFGDDCLQAHLPYSSFEEMMVRRRGLHIIFQYRDPRDILVSAYHRWEKTTSWAQIINLVEDWILPMEPWFHRADTVIRYEHLILQSPEQMATLTELLGKEFVDRIQIGGPSPTFREGRIGDWKTEFPDMWRGVYEKLFASVRYWEWDESTE